MPHHFETRLGISKMSFGMSVTKIIKSIIFIAIIIMTAAQQNKLASPFKFQGISFMSLAHANQDDYAWMTKALDAKVRNVSITITEMESDPGYFTDGTKKDEMDVDIVGKIKVQLAKKLFSNTRIKVKTE